MVYFLINKKTGYIDMEEKRPSKDDKCFISNNIKTNEQMQEFMLKYPDYFEILLRQNVDKWSKNTNMVLFTLWIKSAKTNNGLWRIKQMFETKLTLSKIEMVNDYYFNPKDFITIGNIFKQISLDKYPIDIVRLLISYSTYSTKPQSN